MITAASLRRLSVPLLVFAAALALYARTLAPGLTWAHAGADGGDLLAAALTRGVPHPGGYPTYELLLRAALALRPAAPAWAGNALSAGCAALAAALLADLGRRVLQRTMKLPLAWAGAAAAVAALAWAAAPAVWSQAVITEVYTLHALACVGILTLLWRWAEAVQKGAGGAGWLIAAGLMSGLALGNHLSIVVMAPAAAIWLVLAGRHAGHAAWRGAGAAAAAFGAGLAVYLTLPALARGRPPVNWGGADTWAGFAWLVTARPYAPLVAGVAAADLPARLWAGLREAAEQFGGPWGMMAALGGLAVLQGRLRSLWLTTTLAALGCAGYALTYAAGDSFVTLLPVWALAALWLAVALGWTLERVAGKMARGRPRAWLAALILAAALLALPGVALLRHWSANDLSAERAAEDFIWAALAEAEPNAVILTGGDRTTFALWYAVYGLGRRADVAPVNVHLLGYDWYIATLRAHHPDLFAAGEPTGDAAAWLAQLAAARPLYRAEPLALTNAGLTAEAGPTLVRLRAAP